METMKEVRKHLTKQEWEHIKYAGITNIQGLKRTFDDHTKMRAKNSYIEPCWECNAIALKLKESGL